MRARNDTILIHINTRDTSDLPIDERSPSGVWEYNIATRVLTPRFALTDGDEDKGQATLLRSGPIFVPDMPETMILVAGEVEDGGGTGIGLWAEDAIATPHSYFITPELSSTAIQDAFTKALIKARTLRDDESIVLKYRTSKVPEYPQYNDIVWLDATRFTTTDSSFANASEGEEIEVVSGYRGGHLAHITGIDTSSATYTVTIDDSIGLLNETSVIRLQNWTKVPVEYLGADGETKTIGVDQTAPWIQFKVCGIGEIEFRQFMAIGNSKTQA